MNESSLPPGSSDLWGRITSSLATFADAVGSFITTASYFATASISFVHEADVIARKYRWGVSTAWPIQLIFELGVLAHRNAPAHAVSAYIVAFYRRDGWRELELLVKNTCRYSALKPFRRRVLREAIAVLRASESHAFNASLFIVPQLFAQLEGVLSDFARSDLKVATPKGKTVTIRQIVAHLRKTAASIERPALNLIGNTMFRSYERRKFPKGKALLSRHAHAHGRIQASVGLPHVVRIFLAIDTVSYLIDKYRGSTSNSCMEIRSAYAEILRSVSRSGTGLAPQVRAMRELLAFPEPALPSHGDSDA